MANLIYPVGSFVLWCDEYYKVIENYFDYAAKVMDMGGDVCNDFYFNAFGETAVLITNPDKINELNGYLK